MKQIKFSHDDLLEAWNNGTVIKLNGKEYGVARNNAKQYFLMPIANYRNLNEYNICSEQIALNRVDENTYEIKKMISDKDFTEEIIYTAENDGQPYTKSDFLRIAKGNEKYAQLLIDRVEWQHPETLVEEDLMEGEIIEENGTYKLVN